MDNKETIVDDLTIDLDLDYSLSNNYDFGNITIGVASANTAPWSPYDAWGNEGKITLTGPNADIEVNGQSMMTMLEEIQQRLNVLRPNPELEAQWDQLRELGEQYRKLETEIIEKQKVWNTLKQ